MTRMVDIGAAPALPQVDVEKDGRNFRVDWDYQEAPESKGLIANEYLCGYINGAIAALDIPEKKVSCAVAQTGTVRDLNQDVAIKLADLLKNVLHSAVSREHARLKREASLPHL